MTALFDVLGFSGIWVAIAAAALATATAAAFGQVFSPALAGFAFGGTFCIYAVDRLRDVARDRETVPRRSEFITRYRPVLATASAAAALLAMICAVWLGVPAVVAAAVAGGFGFFHRRLKHVPFLKGFYVAASWAAVTIALPAWLARPRPAATTVAWSVAIVGAALLANAIATSARDDEAAAQVLGTRGALRVARIIAAAGVVAAWFGPPPAHNLGAIAVATALALAAFIPGERYELVLDGALTCGALWSLL